MMLPTLRPAVLGLVTESTNRGLHGFYSPELGACTPSLWNRASPCSSRTPATKFLFRRTRSLGSVSR